MHCSARTNGQLTKRLTLAGAWLTRPLLLAALLVAAAACGKQSASGPAADPSANPKAGPQLGAAPPATPAASATPVSAGLKTAAAKDLPPPPLQLTASDGQGLQLTKLTARAVLDGPLALTELHLTFANTEARQRQGTFEMTLPPGAQVSRFAMKNAGSWMEGEVVEKQRARRVYEDFLHRKQDPAILEQSDGNRFSARVFPILPNAEKELIVSYTQTLVDARAPYVLPLRGLPKLGELTISGFVHGSGDAKPVAGNALGATIGAVQTVRVDKKDWQPDADFEVSGQHAAVGEVALRHENLALARVVLPGTQTAAKLERVVVLVDTSASQVLVQEALVQRVQAVLELIGRDGGEAIVLAFDQNAAELGAGPAKGLGEAVQAGLRRRGALGATDLHAALHAAGKAAAQRWKAPARLVLISDGVATAGEVESDALAKAAKAQSGAFARLDAVAVTPGRNQPLLAALTTAGLADAGLVIDAAADPEALGALQVATVPPLQVSVPGAEWVWPQQIAGKRAGEAVLIYADLPADKPFAIQLQGAAGKEVTPPVRSAAKVLLERAWVGARIERLLHAAGGDPDLQAAMRSQALALSVKHRVLCELTALLVLESEHDYVRYNIPRTALAEILTVSPEGVAVLEPRKDPFAALAKDDDDGSGITARTFGGPSPSALRARFEAAEDNAAAPAEEAKSAEAAPPAAAAPAAAAPSPPPEPEPVTAREFGGRADEVDRDLPAPGGMALRGVGSGGGGSGQGRGLGFVPMPRGRGAADEAEEEADSRMRRREVAARRPRPEPTEDDDGGDLNEIRDALKAKPALTGKYAEIDARLQKGQKAAALQEALAWRQASPTDVLALVALGRSLQANQLPDDAARAYGALIDLYPMRADLRRFAGNLLESLGKGGSSLATDSYGKAKDDRPDHPSVYIMLAVRQLQDGKALAALDTLDACLKAERRGGNFGGVERIATELMGIAAAAALAQAPEAERAALTSKLQDRLRPYGATVADKPSLRFVLSWETDANDVDFHIVDKAKNHASYRQMHLQSGGELFADITTGYGPECFAIAEPRAFPYQLYAHYYAMGPMGYGMGRVQILRHDGKGKLTVEDRPFVIMQDSAWLDLGVVKS